MNRPVKSCDVLAGVSLIALSISLGTVPVFAGDYVIDSDVIDVVIKENVSGSVINNAVIGNGGSDFGIKVKDSAVIADDLVNNGTVTADYTAWGVDAATSVSGIVVKSGGQVEGQVINNGTVSASADAVGATASSQGYGIVTEGDDDPDIHNSEGASVSADASASADDYALAIAGGVGEAAGSADSTDLVGFYDLGAPETGIITNEGSIDATASANIISGGDSPTDTHAAIALAFGAGQLIAASQASATVTNASGADISVSASAGSRYYPSGLALAAGGGIV